MQAVECFCPHKPIKVATDISGKPQRPQKKTKTEGVGVVVGENWIILLIASALVYDLCELSEKLQNIAAFTQRKEL